MPVLEPRLTVVHAALDAVSSAFAQAEVVFDDTKRERDPAAYRATLLASSDPLTRARAPPANETPAQRAARHAAELDAKRISDMIDAELARQRAAESKGRKPVKILLLGMVHMLYNVPLFLRCVSYRTERVGCVDYYYYFFLLLFLHADISIVVQRQIDYTQKYVYLVCILP